jgi:flagellar hook-associated protein 3 FlgL
MKTTFISTKAISEATRLSLLKVQTKLADAQKEMTTGRLADVGKSLGYRAGQTVSLRQEHTRLTSMIDVNGITDARLDITQQSLKTLLVGAQDFVSQLIAARDVDIGPTTIQPYASAGLTTSIDALNNSLNGAYLFSGINADVKPVAGYFQNPPGANEQAVDAAFLTAFGMTQSNPGLSAVLPADMQTFLDGAFADMFEPPQWTTAWSSASDQNARSRISTHELVDTSTNANAPGVRKLISAYTMMADLGVENLSQATFQTVVDNAIRIVGEAIKDLSQVQGNLGVVQERVSLANERMSIQIDILAGHIGVLEGVDPYEASTRIAALTTQIETAYTLTARLQRLSLLNYL